MYCNYRKAKFNFEYKSRDQYKMNLNSNPSAKLTQSEAEFRENQRFTGPGFFKKRKLSLDGSESESIPSVRKDSLDESFSALTLSSKSEQTASTSLQSSNATFNLSQQDLVIKIPKPIKLNSAFSDTNSLKKSGELPNPMHNKDQFIENLLKISQTDPVGISKYLDLDLNSKLESWDRTVKPEHKKLSSSIITSFFNSPYSTTLAAYMNPLINSSLMQISRTNTTSFGSIMKNNFNQDQAETLYIGPLTKEERKERIDRYLEKKKNRLWKNIRYNVRKVLADKRERVQGRFVKTKKSSPFQMMEEIKSDGASTNNDSFISQIKRENLMESELARNNLSDSSSDLRKSNYSDK